jgi:hypothetical protein
MISVGDMVIVAPSFFEGYHRTCLGLRPSPDVLVHDETSPGLAYPGDTMLVIRVEDTTPTRCAGQLVRADICVLHPRGFTGWIFEPNLVVP